MKTEIPNKILTLGIVKPCQANFLIKNLLGDQSASDDSQSNIFHRLNIAIYGVPFVPKISNIRI